MSKSSASFFGLLKNIFLLGAIGLFIGGLYFAVPWAYYASVGHRSAAKIAIYLDNESPRTIEFVFKDVHNQEIRKTLPVSSDWVIPDDRVIQVDYIQGKEDWIRLVGATSKREDEQGFKLLGAALLCFFAYRYAYLKQRRSSIQIRRA